MLTTYTAPEIRSDTKQQPEFSSIIESTLNELVSIHPHIFTGHFLAASFPAKKTLQLFSRQFENNSFTASSTLFNIYQVFHCNLEESQILASVWLFCAILGIQTLNQWIGASTMNEFVHSSDFKHLKKREMFHFSREMFEKNLLPIWSRFLWFLWKLLIFAYCDWNPNVFTKDLIMF